MLDEYREYAERTGWNEETILILVTAWLRDNHRPVFGELSDYLDKLADEECGDPDELTDDEEEDDA